MDSGLEIPQYAVVRAAPVAHDPVEAQNRPRRWRRRLVRFVVAGDVVAVAGVATLAVVLGVHEPSAPWDLQGSLTLAGLVTALVLGTLTAFRCWDPHVLGQGPDEFNRVYRALTFSVMLLGLGGLAIKTDVVRPWVFGVLPMTALALIGVRALHRVALRRARLHGRCMSRVLVVGTEDTVADLVARSHRAPQHGWTVVGACLDEGHHLGEHIHGVPLVGHLDEVASRVRQVRADVVALAPAPGWTSRRLHRLAWELEGSGVEIVVDPGLMEVGGPRLQIAPVDGLPLLRLTEPRFSGAARIIKSGTDRVVAALLLVCLTPLFVVIAALVKRDGGPVFFRQERVGLGGRTFLIIKFRSMAVDADRQIQVLSAASDGSGPLFKMRTDPRVTPVGRALRRLSLDELPQLFNVVAGSMSLVGPRPPLAHEVATYADDARRKLLVRPGLTGLWQVSGRSDLSWEESVRLDLRYVENWSPALDLSILWRTIGAVVRGRGAY